MVVVDVLVFIVILFVVLWCFGMAGATFLHFLHAYFHIFLVLAILLLVVWFFLRFPRTRFWQARDVTVTPTITTANPPFRTFVNQNYC